jgi:hypothetical protein
VQTTAAAVQTLATDFEAAPASAKGLLAAVGVVGASAFLFSQVRRMLYRSACLRSIFRAAHAVGKCIAAVHPHAGLRRGCQMLALSALGPGLATHRDR